MIITPETTGLDPVIFDPDTLPSRYAENPERIKLAFAHGDAEFDDPLMTTVAMAGGITATGKLDMPMYAATRQVSEYLGDKQGLPMLFAETSVEPDGIEHPNGIIGVIGYLGVVSDLQDPVGLIEVPQRRGEDRVEPGIALTRNYAHLDGAYTPTVAHSTMNYRLGETVGPIDVVPLLTPRIVIGRPGNDTGSDRVYQQVVVAGEDIAPWLHESFPGGFDYKFFKGIVRTLLKINIGEGQDFALDSLLDPQFVESAEREHAVLQTLDVTLTDYSNAVDDLHKQIAGEEGRANIALRAARRKLAEIEGASEPSTMSSDSVRVAHPVDDVYRGQVPARLRAIEAAAEPLNAIVRRTRQLGR